MFARNVAEVLQVKKQLPQSEELEVSVEGKTCRAINYPALTGSVSTGDRVVLNTTAVDLGLGSGGYHFVYYNLTNTDQPAHGEGHIMKLRYTPLQVCVQSVEEPASPHHEVMARATTLAGMPVAVAELHSMLAPLVITIKKENPDLRLAYLMTDGGALPAFFSKTIHILQTKELICGTVTAGHAFGGDLEAVNVHSGLLAARHVLKADAAIVCMGPGVAGTATPYGFSGLEAGENINRVHSLAGRAVAVPRISFADARRRHQGFSHHTLTALTKAALVSADLPLPRFKGEDEALINNQLEMSGLQEKHRVVRYENLSLDHLAADEKLCSTMGRSLHEDPGFFLTVCAAGYHLAKLAGPVFSGAGTG
ncbi:DUF3866 family protein [Dethiobacter alkaliphilus]|uniref:DUF3866 domain-containing protein n=1 Tax=Dethiobacter alkaliphilus AHT 1 TaxID=555088 RepID=C0GE09_DETAL|nr:DUF3866 family protein [Dethiobacter alkaliphilus]EEG78303.1 conserved hypothetical protein [Dethiobacter alkaliphilus AHT 1]